MKKIVGVGASVLDTIIEMDAYPAEDHKAKAERVFVSGGGPVGNALVAIAKLGGNASYLGLLSADSAGKRMKDEFASYGVDASTVKEIEGAIPFTSYIILNRTSGTRTCLFDRGNVPNDPTLPDYSPLEGASILHLDGNCLPIAIEAAKRAKEKGILVSLDAGGLYAGIEELLPYVDILIPSEEFAMGITKKQSAEEAMETLYDKYQPKVLVITQGSKGGIYWENGKAVSYPSFKVNCVDSNGAGDTFHGAFLVRYLDGFSVKECCRFASATSAIKCQRAGVRVALPTKEEVETFLANK